MTLAQKKRTVQRVSAQEIEAVMRSLLGEISEELAAQTGFVKRRRAISGAIFAQACVFGWLVNPEASSTQLQQMLAILGCTASAQALEQRMNEAGAAFLLSLLGSLLGICVESEEAVMGELLHRFSGVYLQDGSIITLPDALRERYRGCGGGSSQASRSAMRIQVRLNLSTGGLTGPYIQGASACEREGEAALQEVDWPACALVVTDSAYVTLEWMREAEHRGLSWLTHARSDWQFQDSRGVCLSLEQWLARNLGKGVIDEWVTVGKRSGSVRKVRLIAFRVSDETVERRAAREGRRCKTRHKGCRRDVRVGSAHKRPSIDGRHRDKTSPARQRLREWTILITNVAEEVLAPHEARVLMRARWQIELLWCLWKKRGQIDIWRSEKPMRILCEIYAKLIGMVFQHWLILRACWADPHRSLQKAQQVVQLLALPFLLSLWKPLSNRRVQRLVLAAMVRAQVHRRPVRFTTSQLLERPTRVLRLN